MNKLREGLLSRVWFVMTLASVTSHTHLAVSGQKSLLHSKVSVNFISYNLTEFASNLGRVFHGQYNQYISVWLGCNERSSYIAFTFELDNTLFLF